MHSGRLLLADRHLGVLGGVHGLLHDLFDSVVMVADEQSLEDAVAELGPDLLVMELALPGGRDAGLAGRLLARHPGLTIVVLSDYDEPSVADRLLADGVKGVVLKRAAGTELLPAIRAALAGDTYVSPAVHHGREAPRTRVSGDAARVRP